MIRSIQNIPLENRRVLIRADFDLPIGDKTGLPKRRIDEALPTIIYALEQGAKVVVATHQGPLTGKWSSKRTIEPSVQYVVEKLGKGAEAILTDDCIGGAAAKLISELTPGKLLFLENLAMNPDEGNCGSDLAEFLARQCDVYVNEAFSHANRRLASTVLLPGLVPEKCAGIAFMREFERIDSVRKKHLPACVALNT